MGEETEPMIDQEMFHQMMESMDKDGDGTVTKVIPQCIGPHSTHGHAPAALQYARLSHHWGGLHTRSCTPAVVRARA
mgnify:CR=1 FL=1